MLVWWPQRDLLCVRWTRVVKKYLEVILGCVQGLEYWKSQHEEHELKSKLLDKQVSDVHM